MKVFIENPSGVTLKKEFLDELGEWKTIGHLAVPYPYPYGFVLSTAQEDGDPLDAFLITSEPSKINRGKVLEISVLGLVEYFEDEQRDYKILVRKKEEEVAVSDEIKEKIKNFLLHAFDNRPEKKVKFGGFRSIEEANKEIERCQLPD